MFKYVLFILSTLLLISCDSNSATDNDKDIKTDKTTIVSTPFNAKKIAGKYASEDGDLKISVSEGMVLFDLLVVAPTGRTGSLVGEMQMNNNIGVYLNPSQDCDMRFNFSNEDIILTQKGSCEMGMGVSASATYKSMSKQNAASVIGAVGDSLGSLFYADSEDSYQHYCKAGMEEESGNIICKAKLKSGDVSHNIVHIFSGNYSGPDGELPPLSVAKTFIISVTR